MRKTFKNQRLRRCKGSVLIWTLMLGFVLTSVFFFFGMRQRMNVEVQRDTAEILNTRAYLKSFADYLESNNTDWDSGPDDINAFDGITGYMTQNVDEIPGFVDTGIVDTYNFSDEIFIEWNKCEDGLYGDLILNDVPYHSDKISCTDGYADVAGPFDISGSLEIKTLNAPFQYRITGPNLVDNKWHLEISTKLTYGKKIKVERVFEAP